MIGSIRPVSTGARPCKICGAPAPLFGVVDFNRSCEEARGRYLPLSGIAIYYRRCPACGFLFTDGFDDWTEADFKKHIYNDDYLAVDPDYRAARPAESAKWIAGLFDKDKSRLRVLDYGGGNGQVSDALRRGGFLAAETYDPFTPEFSRQPSGRFEIVSCFETLEHLPDPMGGIAALASFVAEPGIVVFSTLVQPADLASQRMNWWYIAPRNGHISMFTRLSLGIAWKRHGFAAGSFDDRTHIAFRQLPDFASHLTRVP
jgi:2-polyprenyl-6-hydroxyphenyl methylase/3-demethylubiquinone-9 3-methyltransferase